MFLIFCGIYLVAAMVMWCAMQTHEMKNQKLKSFCLKGVPFANLCLGWDFCFADVQ